MFETVGVRPQDEAAYRALLNRPRLTTPELAGVLDRDVVAVRRSVGRLEQLGLVSRVAERPVRWIPARPDVAVDVLVARRKEELVRAQRDARELLDEMTTERDPRPDQIVEVVVGRQAVATRFAQLVQAAEHELLVFDRPPYVTDADAAVQMRDLRNDGVRVRTVYAPESLGAPGGLADARAAAAAGESARVSSNLPMKLAIVDGCQALLPLAVDQMVDSALVIRPSALLDALVVLFEMLWAPAVPLFDEPPAGSAGWLGDDELLALMAAGLKDDAIGRQLGVSSRTVSRRVAEVMERLQADTRFQAGVQAARRGRVPD